MSDRHTSDQRRETISRQRYGNNGTNKINKDMTEAEQIKELRESENRLTALTTVKTDRGTVDHPNLKKIIKHFRDFTKQQLKEITEIEGFEMAYQLLSFEELNAWLTTKLKDSNKWISVDEGYPEYVHGTDQDYWISFERDGEWIVELGYLCGDEMFKGVSDRYPMPEYYKPFIKPTPPKS